MRKYVFSGVQPSGCLTLGNYLGAIKNWVPLQDQYFCLYSVVDQHAITVRQNPAELRDRSMDFLIQYIACGIDPQKSLIFFQSHVYTHTALSWVLNCFTTIGELSRMTQFKDKSKKNENNINAGLFTYPVLMAADILLYNVDLVPVGQDQKQHLELCRDIAIRFNAIYGDTFRIPNAFIPPKGAKIMSLTDPTKKMSKSDANPNAFINILDSPDLISKKIKRAVTDSIGEVGLGEGREGITNLLSIYASVNNCTLQEALEQFEGKGYGYLKNQVAQCVVEELSPIQEKFRELKANPDYIESVYKNGAKKALDISEATLYHVFDKIGYVKH